MPIIDVQVHAYERNGPDRPWLGHLHGPPSATGEEMVAAMDAFGFTDRLSDGDKATLMGGTCERVYGFTPRRA